MDKIYFEMNEAEQILTNIKNNMEFAHCKIAEGILGEVKNGYTVEMVNDIGKNVTEHLEKVIAEIEMLLEAYADGEGTKISTE